MQQKKKSVTARIPEELYYKCNQQYENMTDAVVAGLELLCNTDCKTSVISNMGLIEEKDRIIKDLQSSNVILNKELENLKTNPQLHILQDTQEKRIDDLKAQINSLHEQLKVKDSQLSTRDAEINQLAENIKGQALTIHNLTSKQLPEPKKWYQFWLR